MILKRIRGRRLELSRRMTVDDLPEASTPHPNQMSRLKAVPLHQQIRREIAELISRGTWPGGSLLPNETSLAEMLGVAVGTVRRALADLAADGLIARHPKTGTIVTGRTPHLRLEDSFHYFRLHGPGDSLARAQSRIFGYERRLATPREADILRLDADASVHKFERVRRVDGIAVMRDHVVFPVAIAPDIETVDDIPQTLAIYFLERYGIRVAAQREKLSAALADETDRRILERSGEFAVLVIDEIAFDQIGKPVILAFHHAITENFKYLNEVS